MKNFSIVLLTLFSFSTFAATGAISVTPSENLADTLDITVEGQAAQAISDQLSDFGVKFRREPFSGALVQRGEGVRCIKQHRSRPLYCYMSLTGSSLF